MDEGLENVLLGLRDEFAAGDGLALIHAIHISLRLDERAPQWVLEAVSAARKQWIDGETRQFAEPWGLTRPKGWHQARHKRDVSPVPQSGFRSLRGAVLHRISELTPEEKKLADEYGGVFVRVAEEFSDNGISSSQARKWWYASDNPYREPNSRKTEKE